MLKWKHARRLALALLASAAVIASSGCVKRSILAFEDHPKHPLTTLQVFESKNYYVYKQSEHRFFMCIDTGDKLVCKRSCGGNTDVGCPVAVMTGYGGGSNVR